jgi:hypothetical protein
LLSSTGRDRKELSGEAEKQSPIETKKNPPDEEPYRHGGGNGSRQEKAQNNSTSIRTAVCKGVLVSLSTPGCSGVSVVTPAKTIFI